MKTLEFLEIYHRAKVKSDYLIHRYDVINIALDKGDDYNTLFQKLQKRAEGEGDPELSKAVEDWIAFQKSGSDPQPDWTTIIANKACWAIFDLKPVRNETHMTG